MSNTVIFERVRVDNMISFEGFSAREGSPIYIQIILYIKRGVVAGTIKDGDELPSRRMLSSLLSVNPNTVQKAYRLLEEESLIVSQTGAKSLMVVDVDKKKKIRSQLLEDDTLNIISTMKGMGISKTEALELIEKYWERGEEDEEASVGADAHSTKHHL